MFNLLHLKQFALLAFSVRCYTSKHCTGLTFFKYARMNLHNSKLSSGLNGVRDDGQRVEQKCCQESCIDIFLCLLVFNEYDLNDRCLNKM